MTEIDITVHYIMISLLTIWCAVQTMYILWLIKDTQENTTKWEEQRKINEKHT